MIDLLLEPFAYEYMSKAIFISTFVGIVCAFLSCYLMLRGWSLIGDALSHSVVPGVAFAYLLGFSYAIGAFLTGFFAAFSMAFLKQISFLKEDAIIGFIFTTFFALGLLIVSMYPTAISINSIIFGNILGISNNDIIQILIITLASGLVLLFIYKDLFAVFFDEAHASSIGLNPKALKLVFFTLLSACTVAALQTVGSILVIAMVITPGATAYLLSDKFKNILVISTSIGGICAFFGSYLSYFFDGATGAIIVLLQSVIFIFVFVFAPKYGLLANKYQSTKGGVDV